MNRSADPIAAAPVAPRVTVQIDGVPQETVDDLLERRQRRGYNPEGSGELLEELVRAHSGENLAVALIAEGFAHTASARRAVREIEDAAAPPKRNPSPSPQSVDARVLRAGDTLADGEFEPTERVVNVVSDGDNTLVTTDASIAYNANPYRMPRGTTVWAVTPD